uniref:Sushi domain-containing protein n=1 Tax=Maylandia zebra TaxID=106582 RepID=A0A3P9DTJ6_9CICH
MRLFGLSCLFLLWLNPNESLQQNEVTCSHPQALYLDYWGDSGQQQRLGDSVSYTCGSDYRSTDGAPWATCTRDGWKPNPLCQGAQGCGRPPPLSDGDTKTSTKHLYQHNEKVEYICQRYYVMKGGPFKTCNHGEWTGEIRCLPCTVNRDDMNRHNIQFRFSRDDKLYTEHDDEIEFMCTRGRPVGTLGMRQKCEHGVVHLPTCQ